MKKVEIDAGACGMKTTVLAESEDGMNVSVTVRSDCENIKRMMEDLGDAFNAYALCLSKPGTNELYRYAAEHFPGHAACPALAGITKCAEAECGLALAKDSTIKFT
jgi:hypothetical protein